MSWMDLAAEICSVLAERIDLRSAMDSVTALLCEGRPIKAGVIVPGVDKDVRIFHQGFSDRLIGRTTEVFGAGHRLLGPVSIERATAARDYPLWTAAAREEAAWLEARPLMASNRNVGELLIIGADESDEGRPPDSILRLLESVLATAVERDELFRQKTGQGQRGEALGRALGEAVLSGAAGGVMVTDLRGVALLINDVAERALGVTASEIVGEVLAQRFPRLGHMMDRGLGGRFGEAEQDFQVQVGGGSSTVRVRANRFEAGGLDYVLWHFGDDAENAELRSKISVQASRFTSLLDSAPSGSSVVTRTEP